MRESSARMNVDIVSDYNKEAVDIYNRIVKARPLTMDQPVMAGMPAHKRVRRTFPTTLYDQAETDSFVRWVDYLVGEYHVGEESDVAICRYWLDAIKGDSYPAGSFPNSVQIRPTITPPVPISSPISHPRLEAALEDLKDCKEEAREKDFPEPTETALRNAEKLLEKMYKRLPRRFEVYPMPNGAIAIQASHPPEIAVSVLCESDGGALCLVSASDDDSRRAWYSKAEVLPDGFLNDALDALRSFKS